MINAERYYVDYKVLKKQIKRYEMRTQHEEEDTAEVVRLFAETLDAQVLYCTVQCYRIMYCHA